MHFPKKVQKIRKRPLRLQMSIKVRFVFDDGIP